MVMIYQLKRMYRALLARRCQSRLAKVGDNLRVEGRVQIYNPERCSIGEDVHLGKGFWAACAGGLTIGDHVVISYNCHILTTNHDPNGNALPYGTEYQLKPVAIGNCVWIGMDVKIVPGVTIGEGAVVAMGSVVTSDVAPWTIVGGNPAKQIGERNAEHAKRLMNSGAYIGALRGLVVPKFAQKKVELAWNNAAGQLFEKDLVSIPMRYRKAALYQLAVEKNLDLTTEDQISVVAR